MRQAKERTPETASCGCDHDGPPGATGHTATHKQEKASLGMLIGPYYPAVFSLSLLITGLLLNVYLEGFRGSVWAFLLFLVAYVVVGKDTLLKAVRSLPTKNIFNEFLLMTIATIGAFALGEYAEAVAVMLFYEVGELFNGAAVQRAKRSIKAMLDLRPTTVSVRREGKIVTVAPETVCIGEVIQLRSGERAALDGELLGSDATFDTAALTGESMPMAIRQGEKVLAGMICQHKLAEIRVSSRYAESTFARILDMVQHANSRKARTERFISRIAKIYTPAVVFAALAVAFLPYVLLGDAYIFREWSYRALIFLVISCPCALMISIPLGYFGGIGASSRNGILCKGANFLDVLNDIDTMVFDKTGTLTKGVFKVQEVYTVEGDQEDLMIKVAALQSRSTHPIARAISQYAPTDTGNIEISDVEEIPGRGMKGTVAGEEVLAGNAKLLRRAGISFPCEVADTSSTVVLVAIDGSYRGHITIADELKEDAHEAVQGLHKAGINNIIILSGDKTSVTKDIAQKLQIGTAYGDLLPEDKVAKVEALKQEGKRLAFVGDGINDAPVIALADVGVAMGGLGSDAAIEIADVVIQTDQPSKVVTAVKIAKATRRIVWQNIALAFGVKGLVMIMGIWGLATLWEAIFADVGVALLAILNAMRVQRMNFHTQAGLS